MLDNRSGQVRSARRLLVVDDHELARFGLRSMLSGERDLVVVGEATNGRQAIEVSRRLQPDLILMNIRMPELDGLEATRIIRRESPNISVIIITVEQNPEWLLDAIRAGAAAYLLKGATRNELLSTVRKALSGARLLQPELGISRSRELEDETSALKVVSAKLITPRELQVLRLVAQGYTNLEIAGELILSISTVKRHLEHILAKLGVTDRTEAAVRAAELGLLGEIGAHQQLVS
jgi:DNA-binding NarL/FixJ family response regulator